PLLLSVGAARLPERAAESCGAAEARDADVDGVGAFGEATDFTAFAAFDPRLGLSSRAVLGALAFAATPVRPVDDVAGLGFLNALVCVFFCFVVAMGLLPSSAPASCRRCYHLEPGLTSAGPRHSRGASPCMLCLRRKSSPK